MVASMVIWFVVLTISLSVMMISVGGHMPQMQMLMAAIVSIGIALVAVFENLSLRRSGASKSAIAASTARNMSFVYIFGAVAIALTYLFLLKWKEWWHFFGAFAVVGALCLFYANTLSRDAAAGREDPAMLKIGRTLTWVQLVGMVAAMIGMFVDGKLERYVNPRYTDWAAQHVFFFGAMGLAIISAFALYAGRDDSSAPTRVPQT